MILDPIVDRLVRRSLRVEESLVTRRGAVGLVVRTAIHLIVLLTLAFTAAIIPDPVGGPLRTVLRTLLGGYAAYAVMTPLRGAQAYRRGWLDGRIQTRHAVMEAIHRDMSPHDWIEAELEADAHALGLVEKGKGA